MVLFSYLTDFRQDSTKYIPRENIKKNNIHTNITLVIWLFFFESCRPQSEQVENEPFNS